MTGDVERVQCDVRRAAGVGAFWEGWEGACSGAWLKIQSRSVNSCRACYTCRGSMQRAETRRKRVWQDPMVLLYQWGLGQQTHFTSRCLCRPKQITSYLQGSPCLVFGLFSGFSAPPFFLCLGLENSKPCPLHQRRIRFRMLEEGQEAVVTSQQMAYKLKDS